MTQNKEQGHLIGKSYAQVIAENQIDPACILKIKLTLLSSEARTVLMNRIKSDNLCEDAQIFDITVVGNDFLTIKAANVEDANKIKEAFTNKYRDAIKFETTATFKPTVKISRLFTALRTPEETQDQIINQNKWIDVPEFNIVECYLTKVDTQEFMTVIVECSFELHAILLKRTFIILGVKKSMVHEHVRLLQCGKCWRYGHTGARCSSE